MADAVRLVDGDEGRSEFARQVLKAGVGEPLRRHVDQPVLPGANAAKPCARFLVGERGSEIGGRHAALLESGDLVLHERDQGGNDERRSLEHGRGKLIDEALSAAGRRDEK